MILSRVLAVRWTLAVLMAATAGLHAAAAPAEDGYRLWLRYTPVEQPAHDRYATKATGIVPSATSP